MYNDILRYIPDLEHEEYLHIEDVEEELTPDEFDDFLHIYRDRRMTTQNFLLFTLLGFLGAAGVQRILTKEIGLGVVYLLTGGLFFIGTIYDLIKHKELALDHNLNSLEEAVSYAKKRR